ncbi:MAG TPA: glycosyl hydrolase, partial [Candidatus Hydrogenedentes bacterium]|nr:glycosyl hydrolase [Candidatus Hydrogenedentota bacterium]
MGINLRARFSICASLWCLLIFIFLSGSTFAADPTDLLKLTSEARPWVYWMWKNGNISREGITADLEAMEQAGIGGAIVMEVALSVPPGPVSFFSDEWRAHFAFALQEANRLGLQMVINSAPGWTGSGGPWITAEKSMKKLVFSEIRVTGPMHFKASLPQPESVCDFYRDIAVLAFPEPQPGAHIEALEEKSLYTRAPFSSMPGVRPYFDPVADYPSADPSQCVPPKSVRNISDDMSSDGTLVWDVPEGNWIVLRAGYTSTGQTNRPSPLPGLECDKLNPVALEEHFNAYISKLLQDSGDLAGKTLAGIHFDSWEVGGQNWTDNFQDEFEKRRGYDILPWLPVVSGRILDSGTSSERFLWDLRQTVSEMIVEYHGLQMQRLAHDSGLKLSIEAYDMTPCGNMNLSAAADVPMCEFWSDTFDTRYSVREAASAAHIYGKPIVAAEAFTSVDKWLLHPGAIKTNGDWAFSEGVNRLVIHRYIHQPFMQIRPGLSLGPHGLHYERTQHWWKMARPWHEYLARCQNALRHPAEADLLYLSLEGAPNVFQGPEPAPRGYKYDACTADALLRRVRCEDGFLVSDGDARYRMLILPDSEIMSVPLLEKIAEMVRNGALVVGLPPLRAPGLSGFPEQDEKLRKLAAELWPGERRPAGFQEISFGKGKIFWGGDLHPDSQLREEKNPLADAEWIWCDAEDALAASPGKRFFKKEFLVAEEDMPEEAVLSATADNAFRLWVNGAYAGEGTSFTIIYSFDVLEYMRPGKNLIAFEVENTGEEANPAGLVAALHILCRSGKEEVLITDASWFSAREVAPGWQETSVNPAEWQSVQVLGYMGMMPWGLIKLAPKRPSLYPPSAALEALLQDLGTPPDFEAPPALRFIHRRTVEGALYFVSNGSASAVDAEVLFRAADGSPLLLHPEDGSVRTLPEYTLLEDGRTSIPLHFEEGESYFILFSSKPESTARVAPKNFVAYEKLAEISGPWQVSFDPALGGPEEPVLFSELTDWSLHTSPEIRYYSGPAIYSCDFEVGEGMAELPGLQLDLGTVNVAASVQLNGQDLGICWKKPYRLPLGASLRAGMNHLEINVVNLWVNRI